MAEDTVLALILSEFKLWGVKPKIENTGGGHIKLTWQATPDKEVRTTFLPKTGSDHRGWLNQRANIRRQLQHDGLSLKTPPKPVPILHKVLAAPEPVEPDRDQLRAVRVELADLTEAIFELKGIVSSLVGTMQQSILEAISLAPVRTPEPAPPKQIASHRRIKAIEHVSFKWNSTDALAQSMGISPVFAYRKLYHLTKTGAVQLNEGHWRKSPPPQRTARKAKATSYKFNGRRKRHANGAHA